MTTRPFIRRNDGVLCMHGYPIQIMGGQFSFTVKSDWHRRPWRAQTLGAAKERAYILAGEIDIMFDNVLLKN